MKGPQDLVRAIREDLIEQQIFVPCHVCASVGASMPQDLATEKLVLLQLVIPAVPLETFGGLRPEHFWDARLRQVASVALSSLGCGLEELTQRLSAEHVGEPLYWSRFLSKLYEAEPLLADPATVRRHVERLFAISKRRALHTLSRDFTSLLGIDSVDDAALLDHLRRMAAALKAST